MASIGRAGAARAIALVGPNGSGKTSLMEALLHAAGAIERRGLVDMGNTVGDSSAEARARGQSVETSLGRFDFMGDRYALIDCPGGVEFAGEADTALAAADLALVVIDPDPGHAALIQPVLKQLETLGIPRALFINKIDTAHGRIRDLLATLQPASAAPLVARQIPIWEGERVTGFVDLGLERAFVYRQGKPSEQVEIPPTLAHREAEARFHMLEQLADHDDVLLEQLLSDMVPERDLVFGDLVRETREGLIVPVFFGSASNGFGVRRLLKALRHDTPEPGAAAERIGASGDCAYVFKVSHAGQAGKLAFARVMSGKIGDGADLVRPDGEHARAGGLFAVQGGATTKIASAGTGEVIAVAKVTGARPGELLSADGKARAAARLPSRRTPVYALAIGTRDRKDDVRLSEALAKLVEEDPTVEMIHDAESHQTLLKGQGETQLKVLLDKLKRRYGVAVDISRPRIGYRESIRRAAANIRGRHKKQSGGHGQFGDVVINIRPETRGQGFGFSEKITGGAVPKQWIPAVEMGVKDALERGPLGFPVVDVAVELIDGSYHSVDSSELAFRTAGRLAASDGLKGCDSYLLEPVDRLEIYTPQAATSKITSAVTSRRGQVLGFDAREGWPGWDRLDVYLPQSERQELIAELRALSQGLATYTFAFDHMAELSGRQAEQVVQARVAA
ncbi:elongation factor G [Sphingoaurantiacus capsulatus]|uniref:Elongation factor G n=1 Tax=Sphingoaurantiacus capsulatus TaxID=1771310 RepID=A0ABV7X6Y3_9SPHN